VIAFWGIFLEYFEKNLQFFELKKLYYFVKVCVKIFPKNVIFNFFQIHLQILLLFKSNGYKFFYITFEGPNVNEIFSYFENL
jgi:hypothetical protein